MKLEQVVKICKTLKCIATVSIGSDGEILKYSIVNFHDVSREALLKHFQLFGVHKLTKKTYTDINLSDIDLVSEGLRINHYDKCELIGHKEVVVPAKPEHTKKVPIYKCS